MINRKPLILLASTALLATGSATAIAASQQAQPIDGGADVFGNRVNLDAETSDATTKVTFIYGGKRHAGRLTETDAEDRTKDWDVTVRSLKSDRRPGKVVKFRVKACGSGGCETRRFQEVVEFDD